MLSTILYYLGSSPYYYGNLSSWINWYDWF